MLSDEEREALQYFNTETKTEAMHYGAVLVKLIEKQSKEIEELKDTRSIFNMGRRSYKNEIEDKIKAKIEFIKSLKEKIYYEENVITILQSLLEKE